MEQVVLKPKNLSIVQPIQNLCQRNIILIDNIENVTRQGLDLDLDLN